MGIERDRLLSEIARRQSGLITRAQTKDAGLPASALRRRVAGGQLVERQPDVFQAASAPYDEVARDRAALLAAGSDAVLSHASAGVVWGLVRQRSEDIWVTVPFAHRPPALDRVQLVRSRHLAGMTGQSGSWSATTPPRTWVDLGRVLSREDLEGALATGLQRGLLSLTEIDRVLSFAHHRAGTGYARSVLAHFDPAWESLLSARMGRLLIAAGLAFQAGHQLFDEQGRVLAVLDFADVSLKLAIEVDGWAYHGSRLQQQSDKVRDRRLLARGWRTLRFTTDDVLHRPDRVIAEIRAVLAACA